jgi:hypothetical protein
MTTSGISSGTKLPRVDYTAIEQRIRAEKVDGFATNKPKLEADIASAQATFAPLAAKYNSAYHHATTMNTLKNVGTFTGVSAGIGAIAGAVFGASAELGSTRVRSIGFGMAIGAVFTPMVLGLIGGVAGAFQGPSAPLFHDVPPQSPELVAASSKFDDAVKAKVDAERDAERFAQIKPGQSWMRTPTDQDTGRKTVGTYVEEVFAAHDHDHDGQINIAHPTDMSPANEYMRNRQGGPVANDREAEADLSYPFRLPLEQLQRYDVDHSKTVSREELATGMVTDTATSSGLYWNAH